MKKRKKKFLSILLSAAMLFSSVPTTVLGTETPDTGLCEHHTEHTAECGYVEAVTGADCTHVHDENCYETTTVCVHTHDETCSYVPAAEPTPCGHIHDENCGYAAAVAEVSCGCVPGEDGTLVHTEGCGYVAPMAEQPCNHTHDGSCGYSEGTAEVPCNHACSADNGCVTSALNCQHTHDDTCGYAETVSGSACTYHCEICMGHDDGEEEQSEAIEPSTETMEPSTEATEPSTETVESSAETVESEPVCSCESDDPKYHAPFCDLYVAPAKPECYCVEKCTDDSVNDWCDICYFDVSACTGTDTSVPYDDSLISSGNCGENGDNAKYYIYDTDGDSSGDKLIISGTGATKSFIWSSSLLISDPEAATVKTVVIEEGITTIGRNFLYGMTNLTALHIPDSLQSIGWAAVYGCTSLNDIVFSSNPSLSTLERAAFAECTSLNDPDLLNLSSLQSIGYGALEGTAYNPVILPPSVTSVDGYCINTADKILYVPQSALPADVSEFYCGIVMGYELNHETKEATITSMYSAYWSRFSGGITLPTIWGYPVTSVAQRHEKIPILCTDHNMENRTCKICGYTTMCGANCWWEYENGVLYIKGSGVMNDYPPNSYGCPEWISLYKNDIREVHIAEGISKIGAAVFYELPNLKKVVFEGNGITGIESNAFANCTSLEDIPLESQTALVYIADAAFYGCTGLREVTLSATVLFIRPFNYCTNIRAAFNEDLMFGLTFDYPMMLYKTVNGKKVVTVPFADMCEVSQDIRWSADIGLIDEPQDFIKIKDEYAQNYTFDDYTYGVDVDFDSFTYEVAEEITNPGTYNLNLSYQYTSNEVENGIYKQLTKTISIPFTVIDHEHDWSYSAIGNTITAECTNSDRNCSDPEQSITLTVPANYTYTGDATYSATVEGSIDDVTYQLLYTGTNTGYSSADAPKDADTYTVTLSAGSTSVSDTFTISPKSIANCSVSLSKNSFTYTGKAPELTVTVVDNSVGNTTLTKDTDYTVGTDSGINVGDHKLTVTGAGNYTGTVQLDYSITEKEVSITGAEIETVTYDPNGYALTVKDVTFDGVVEGETLAYTATANLTGTNAAGDRDATVTVTLNDSNYSLATAAYLATVKINKADAAVTKSPTANVLTYTGEEQALVTAGETADGTIYYSLDENGTYSESIPTGKKAVTYTVWYYVDGDDNHSDTEKVSVKVEIKAADPAIGKVTADVVENTLELTAVNLNRENMAVDGKLTANAGQTLQLGENELAYTFTPTDTTNYKTVTGNVKVVVKDTLVPTGTVTFTDAGTVWDKVLETITFGRYVNTDQTVKVTAEDNLSSVADISYYEATAALTLASIQALTEDDWTEMKGNSVTVTAEDPKQFVYYIRLTDGSGNVAYLSTDGATFDTQVPLIDGITDGATYYTTQKFTVTEENLDTVTVNESSVTDYVLTGNVEAVYTVKVTDKAGNTATKKVTMYPISALTNDISDLTEENVTGDHADAVKEAKASLKAIDTTNATEEEKQLIEDAVTQCEDLQQVISDTAKEVEILTGAVTSLNPDTLTKEDKADVEAAVKELKEKLEDANLTTTQEAELQEAITEAEGILAKMEEDQKVKEEALDAAADITETDVTSDDAQALTDTKAKLESLVDDSNYTEEEKAEIQKEIDRITAMESVIEETSAEIGRITEELKKYDDDTVNSDSSAALEQLEKDIQALTEGDNLTDAERTALTEGTSKIDTMQQTVADTGAENDRISDAVDGYDLNTVTSDNKSDLEQLLKDVEEQLKSNNLTDAEKTELNGEKTAVEDLLAKIDGTESLIGQLDSKTDDYKEDSVKSTDKEALQQIITDAQTLIDSGNVTEEEKKTLEETKKQAESLIKVIESVTADADTEDVQKVQDVTAENVKPENKDDLTNAKADLEKALNENSGNYTDAEKEAIREELDRVDTALEVLQNVEAVTGLIEKLPDKLDADAKADIQTAQEAYDALTAYEKTLVDADDKAKLERLTEQLKEAETETETTESEAKDTEKQTEKTDETKEAVATGDDSNTEMWMLTMLGSLLVLLLFGKKRYASMKK